MSRNALEFGEQAALFVSIGAMNVILQLLGDLWQFALLSALGHNQAAIVSYDKAIEFKPDDHEAWYNKSCCHALLGDVEKSIENLQKAIELNPDCREWAKTDADFDGIRSDDRFQSLIGDGE